VAIAAERQAEQAWFDAPAKSRGVFILCGAFYPYGEEHGAAVFSGAPQDEE
jgi:hypothetical protein